VGPNEDEEPGGPVRPKVARFGLAGRKSVITCSGTGRRRFRRVIALATKDRIPITRARFTPGTPALSCPDLQPMTLERRCASSGLSKPQTARSAA
jgi:hypothetical protein